MANYFHSNKYLEHKAVCIVVYVRLHPILNAPSLG